MLSRPATRALLLAVLAALLAAPAAPAQEAPHSLRAPVADQSFYFVMADRFENGRTDNDTGGIAGTPLEHGFDPVHKGFYHGGDLAGIRSQLDYIQGLGTTAIWLTPSFKNRPVQGLGTPFVSAGYHGYWITDFTQIDPHLGTNDELRALVDDAHARGMNVFFDIITNHTADVIAYAENQYDYISKAQEPYRDADGNVFDDADFAGLDTFPALDLDSFPYSPVFPTPADATVKEPDWLNDRTMYHNRGNSTFSGENSLYGDFFGLDDLFTERHEVVDGMIDIYKGWISDFGIDGFRIDTVKHVNDEFWQAFAPEVLEHARAEGKSRFFMFGEVFDTDKWFLSHFTTQDRLQAVLDFGFQRAAQDFAARSIPTTALRAFFEDDDLFTDADSNVYQLPTFLGNHDMGRIGRFVAVDNAGAGDAELLRRDLLAHELMYLSRGQPVIYYGDEQGFTGDGGDQDARQDMFPSQVASYNDDDLIGTDATTADENFDTGHPLYEGIGVLAALTQEHHALRDGAQQHRLATAGGPGVYAFSRIDATDQREYVVAVNNAETARTAAIPTYVARRPFFRLYGAGPDRVQTDAGRRLTLTVPALSAIVYRMAGRVPDSESAPAIEVTTAEQVSDRAELSAGVDGHSFYEVTFYVRPAGAGDWQLVGTDDNAPYRVFYDTAGLAIGTQLEVLAVVRDNAGHTRSDTGSTQVVAREPVTTAIVHYFRPAGDYDEWGLHLWGDAIVSGTDWFDPLQRAGIDGDGAFYEILLRDDSKPVNFIMHTPGGDSVPTTREPGGDRSFTPARNPEIWLIQGDPTVYTSPPGGA